MKTVVTVIIPVLNAEKKLQEVLEALSVQTYPQDRIEIIVVDNGSVDSTREIAREFNVTLLIEEKPGPYAARNKGLNNAGGEIFALLDAGTIPSPQWIEEGVKCIAEKNADLAGGNIVFDIGPESTPGEIFDAITFANNKKLIEREGGAAAGNLFFSREVWEATGPFPEHRTGMDIWWTQKATTNDFHLQFAERAVVYYQPKSWTKGLRKSYRVGTMHPYNMRSSGKSLSYILWHTIRCFFPQDPRKVRQKLNRLDHSISTAFFLKVWGLGCINKICLGLGRVRGIISLNKHSI